MVQIIDLQQYMFFRNHRHPTATDRLRSQRRVMALRDKCPQCGYPDFPSPDEATSRPGFSLETMRYCPRCGYDSDELFPNGRPPLSQPNEKDIA